MKGGLNHYTCFKYSPLSDTHLYPLSIRWSECFPQLPAVRVQRWEYWVLDVLWGFQEDQEPCEDGRQGQEDLWRLHPVWGTQRGQGLLWLPPFYELNSTWKTFISKHKFCANSALPWLTTLTDRLSSCRGKEAFCLLRSNLFRIVQSSACQMLVMHK